MRTMQPNVPDDLDIDAPAHGRAPVALLLILAAFLVAMLTLAWTVATLFAGAPWQADAPAVTVSLLACGEEDGSGPGEPCAWVDPDGTGTAGAATRSACGSLPLDHDPPARHARDAWRLDGTSDVP